MKNRYLEMIPSFLKPMKSFSDRPDLEDREGSQSKSGPGREDDMPHTPTE